jgi:phosphomannomutase
MEPQVFSDFEIAGVYPDQLNEEAAWKIGCATARYLPSLIKGYDRGLPQSRAVCVGRDMRTHSEPLMHALMDGIRAAGIGAIDLGMIDTPQMYFAVNHLGTSGGVQVTASHQPAKYNGFKIFGRGAVSVSVDNGLMEIKHLAMALLHTKGKLTGSLKTHDLTDPYRKHVLKSLRDVVKKRKVAIDASNGMAGKILPAIFSDVPIDIVEINFEHAGKFKHDPDPLTEKNLSPVRSAVKREGCDFGICFDGDADRMVMLDETGETVGGDLLTAFLVPYFLEKKPKSAIVYDVRSSRVVMEEIIKYGGTPRRERVGHPYMKKAMRDTHAIFGGELAGRFFYEENYYTDSVLMTLVHVLNVLDQADKPLSERIKPLRRYYGSGEVVFNVEDKDAVMADLVRRYGDGQIDHLDGVTIGFKEWWFNCRPSSTESSVRLSMEAKTKELLDEKLAEIQGQLGTPV